MLLLDAPAASLSEKIASNLRDLILHGQLRPGERVVEIQVARELEVSQASVREALLALEREGLVTRVSNRGTFVTKLSIEDIRRMFRLRGLLEGLAIELASEMMEPAHIDVLRQLIKEMESEGLEGDFPRFQAAVWNFHTTMWRFSGDPVLERVLHGIARPLFSYVLMQNICLTSAAATTISRSHQCMLNAISDGHGKGKVANRLMQKTMKWCCEMVTDGISHVTDRRFGPPIGKG